MALVKQNIPISFLYGLDTKDDRKQVLPGRLLSLENGIFATPSEIRKRNGFMGLSRNIDGDGHISNGVSTMTFLDELLEFDGTSLYSFAEANQEWTPKGKTVSTETSLFPVIRNTYQQTSADMAEHSSGLQVFVWEDSSGGCRYSVVDALTGQGVVVNQLVASTATKPKAMAIGVYLLIFYVDSSSHHLRYLAIPVASPLSPLSIVDVATDLDTTNSNYDVCLLSSRLFIAYNNSDVSGGISIKDLNAFLVLSSAVDTTGENADGCLTIIPDAALQQLWVIYYNGTALKYFIKSYSLTAVLAPTSIETVANVVRVIGAVNNGSGSTWYEISAVVSYNTLIRTVTLTNTGTVGTPGVFVRSVGIAAKPFTYLNVVYFVITFDSPQQATYFIISKNGNIVGKAVPDNGGGLLTKNTIPETVQLVAGTVSFALLQKDLLTTIGGQAFTQTGVSELTIDFTSQDTFYRSELGRNLHITGGLMEMYDGANVVEHSFNVFPEGVSVAQAGSGVLSNGSYQYSVTYEWTDNQGQIHRSTTSVPSTIVVTGGGNNDATLTIPTLRLTQKTGVRVVVYRTEADGTIFYQVTSTTSPLLNNPAVDTVSFHDTVSDATLVGNPILYTTGGVLDNFQAPSTILITTFNNRIIYVPAENRLSFGYSKQIVQGAPVEFAEEFNQAIDQRGGNLTGIEQLDDKLILFKENNIFYVIGNGPDNTGANNDFSAAQLITTDGGCINARSIVTVPAGLMYKSSKGFYLLGRDLSVNYIGAPVEAFNGVQVTSALLIPNTTQVRFSLSNSVVLVYDYYVKQWSTFTNLNVVDATIFQGLHTFVDNNGTVHQETPGQFTDNNEFIKLKLTTSWLSMAELQGFQRAYRVLVLGEYISPHQLLVGVAYDFNPSVVQQDYINTVGLFDLTDYGQDSPYGNEYQYGGTFPLYQFRVNLARQKCQSIQFTMEDVQSSNFGEGLSLSAFNLMIGVKKGSNKLPTTQTFN